MIDKSQIQDLSRSYNEGKISIGTLGSHSALNIFKGAKDEGFRTVCVCPKDRAFIYKRFPVADEIIFVDNFSDILKSEIQERLRSLNTILVPHGSFNAYIKMESLLNDLYIPFFGNRRLLMWETDREKQKEWLSKAGLNLPRTFKSPKDIDCLAIAKFPGARGGQGYFLVDSEESFKRKSEIMIGKGHIKKEELENMHFQEYVLGVNMYFQYFYSPLDDAVELLGMDKRYESNVDTIGRITARDQLQMNLTPTYTIVGNIPLTLRESLLPEVLNMGDKVVEVSKKVADPGIIGPFCLETIISEKTEIYTFEISARIVAGSNVGIGTSPYSYLKYGEGMYMGRRIAREIKNAVKSGELEKIVY
jgi:5-formaminoimidazole-4-carboxamide-1-(beta)-D-ribofuranosyl 5'-monophosphate synthetase